MSQQTCDKHDDCIVVWEGPYYSDCPICREITELTEKVAKLESEVEDLEKELTP